MNKSTLSTLISLSTLITFLIFSCTKDVGKKPVETPTTTTTTTTTGTTTTGTTVDECDTITFAKHIKPLVDANCGTATGCHTGSAPSGGVLLTTYDEVKGRAQANAIKNRVFDENPSIMPPAPSTPLTAAQKKLLSCWINKGYKP